MSRDRRAEVLTRGLRESWADPDASPLRVRRLAAGLGQADLAARAGLAPITVLRAEEGRASEATWIALATALGCTRAAIDREHARRLAPFLR